MNVNGRIRGSSSDPAILYEYRPGHLYLNITNRCTNKCRFCAVRRNRGLLGPFNLNLAGVPRVPLWVHPKDTRREISAGKASMEDVLDAEPSGGQVIAALDEALSAENPPVEEVVFCGSGEPLIRLNTVLEVGEALKRRGIGVRVNTNGQADLIHGPEALERLGDVVDRIFISLNAQDSETYNYLSRPSAGEEAFESLLDFSSRAVKLFPYVTLSVVELSPGEIGHDKYKLDLAACKTIADRLGAGFRVR